MLIAKVNKSNLTIEGSELITSGSVNTVGVQFEFSEDWEGLDKTVIFKTKKVSIPVSLGDWKTSVAIPWEVMAFPNEDILMGVYGVRFDDETTDDINEETVLPTIWANLGKVTQGVSVENPPITAPTKDSYLELLECIKDLSLSVNQSGSGGTIFDATFDGYVPMAGDAYAASHTNFVGAKPVAGSIYNGFVCCADKNYMVRVRVDTIFISNDSENMIINFLSVIEI